MKGRKTKTTAKKVGKNFSGECQLRQLPGNTYFRVIKKDGTLSKTIYFKDKESWNPFTRKYDVNRVDDVYGNGKEMKGTIKVSTKFTY